MSVAMSAKTMAEPVPRKKRSRRDTSPDSDAEKRRGRPRVDKQDESAADRRRTQIRLAQRAYRQRKESSLDELRGRVSELINTIELMHKSFSDCRDRLYASTLHRDQMKHLEEVSSQFELFVKDARHPSEEPVVVPSKPARQLSTESSVTETPIELFGEARNVSGWLDQSVLKRPPRSRTLAPMGYETYADTDSADREPILTSLAAIDVNVPMQDLVPFDSRQTFQPGVFDTFLDDIVQTSPLAPQLSPPITYSFQETSFARRLHRASAERAYQTLSDPRRRPHDYERVFKLSLMGRDRAKLIAALNSVLERGPHEDLDFWQAPLIHVGGAGTHYPRRDPFGNLLPKKTTHNLGIIGPQTLALLENAARDNLTTEMTVEIAGYEGEWFDGHDVQGYLEEKGIFIDPTSSFAEAEIVEWSPTSSGSSATTSTAVSRGQSTPLTAHQVQRLTAMDADLSQWNDYTDMELGSVGFSDAKMGSWMNFLESGHSMKVYEPDVQLAGVDPMTIDGLGNITPSAISPGGSPAPRRKNIIIDVSKLVDVLLITAVCLGRSPGFRRRDVDRALAISSFDAF